MVIRSLGAASAGAGAMSLQTGSGFQEDVYYRDEAPVGKLAMVKVEGMITGQRGRYSKSMAENIIAQIEQATKDKSVKGLLLYLNTPGGEVTASDKIYHAAQGFAATGRPVVAYMDTVAASGGYYIACAAQEVIATETTITGSIGVILGGMNATGLMEKVGLKSQTFASGAFKDTLSMTREMREDERAYIQALVDEMYEKFAGIVSEARDIPLAQLKDGIADGRIFQGSRAKSVGLVDETGYVKDAIQALKTRADLDSAKVVQYFTEPGISDILGAIGVKAQTEPKVQLDWGQGQLLSELQPMVPYMLMEGYE